jgi:Zn-dependent protease with chaperone function
MACATTRQPIRIREITEAEARLVREALTPLLAELNDPAVHRDGCTIALGVSPLNQINASIVTGVKASTCTSFTLILTQGALTRLPVGMLRAVLAHELGHVALHHTGRNSKADEAAADAFAVRLLKRLETRYPDACVQLVYVLSVMAEQGNLAWFAAHPSPDRRAEAAIEGCNR